MADTQFRKASWKMSKDEVRATEGVEPAYESANALGYRGKLVDSECMIYYEFDEQGLARAAYMIDHSDDDRDILDYNKLKSLLSRKYGDPKEDEMDLNAQVAVMYNCLDARKRSAMSSEAEDLDIL